MDVEIARHLEWIVCKLVLVWLASSEVIEESVENPALFMLDSFIQTIYSYFWEIPLLFLFLHMVKLAENR